MTKVAPSIFMLSRKNTNTVTNAVRALRQANTISQKSPLNGRQLDNIALGDTQQQYGGIDFCFAFPEAIN